MDFSIAMLNYQRVRWLGMPKSGIEMVDGDFQIASPSLEGFSSVELRNIRKDKHGVKASKRCVAISRFVFFLQNVSMSRHNKQPTCMPLHRAGFDYIVCALLF